MSLKWYKNNSGVYYANPVRPGFYGGTILSYMITLENNKYKVYKASNKIGFSFTVKPIGSSYSSVESAKRFVRKYSKGVTNA